MSFSFTMLNNASLVLPEQHRQDFVGSAIIAASLQDYLYPNSMGNDDGDAFRHLLWSSISAAYIGKTYALEGLTEYEDLNTGQTTAVRTMDLFNNEIGASFGEENSASVKSDTDNIFVGDDTISFFVLLDIAEGLIGSDLVISLTKIINDGDARNTLNGFQLTSGSRVISPPSANTYHISVQNIQKALINLNRYSGTLDGKNGTLTQTAIAGYEADVCIPISTAGEIRFSTYEILMQGVSVGISDFWKERFLSWQFPYIDSTTHDPEGSYRFFGSSRSSGTRAHAGIDLYQSEGYEVRAMTSGKVMVSRAFPLGDGYNYVEQVHVENDDGTICRYCELISEFGVGTNFNVGQRVEKGDLIGKIKGVKSTINPMLHIEIYNGDNELNTASGSADNLTNRDTPSDGYLYLEDDEMDNYQRRADLINPTGIKFLNLAV